MSRAAPTPSSWAPSPRATSNSVRSVSRSPESATPGSGSISRRNPLRESVAATARAKLAAIRPMRRARSLLRHCRLTVRTIGGSASPTCVRRSPPGRASNSSTGQPASLAWARNVNSSTVLPTPRRPDSTIGWNEFPAAARPIRTSQASISPSRPASSGGGVPAPGAYGLAIGSMLRSYPVLPVSSENSRKPQNPLDTFCPSPSIVVMMF